MRKQRFPNGRIAYKSVCGTCFNNKRRSGEYYAKYKKDRCEFCGFIPVHSCQLAVDHKDGDRRNNKEENLQTLCHNCHFLKTYLQIHSKK